MASVATILGIHCGNIALYHEQAEFFASVVRALTSAIDAKDPYTCGHSDRVARLSVCLARELGCNKEDLNTIYLSGLLHDIGKIGIDDNVLRKPGPLTPEELEHIKTHPDLGCRILDGVKQLDKVLPVVRHHHEAWNGGGYPDGLKGEEMSVPGPHRRRGRLDRRHVERPAVPQRHAGREARQHSPRRRRQAMGPASRSTPRSESATKSAASANRTASRSSWTSAAGNRKRRRSTNRRSSSRRLSSADIAGSLSEPPSTLVEVTGARRARPSHSFSAMLAAWPAKNPTAKICSAKRPRSSNGSSLAPVAASSPANTSSPAFAPTARRASSLAPIRSTNSTRPASCGGRTATDCCSRHRAGGWCR